MIILAPKPHYTRSPYLDHKQGLLEHGIARKDKIACSVDYYLVERFGLPDGTILPSKSQVSPAIQVDVSITA